MGAADVRAQLPRVGLALVVVQVPLPPFGLQRQIILGVVQLEGAVVVDAVHGFGLVPGQGQLPPIGDLGPLTDDEGLAELPVRLGGPRPLGAGPGQGLRALPCLDGELRVRVLAQEAHVHVHVVGVAHRAIGQLGVPRPGRGGVVAAGVGLGEALVVLAGVRPPGPQPGQLLLADQRLAHQGRTRVVFAESAIRIDGVGGQDLVAVDGRGQLLLDPLGVGVLAMIPHKGVVGVDAVGLGGLQVGRPLDQQPHLGVVGVGLVAAQVLLSGLDHRVELSLVDQLAQLLVQAGVGGRGDREDQQHRRGHPQQPRDSAGLEDGADHRNLPSGPDDRRAVGGRSRRGPLRR
jgi:hypothetical protein